MKNQYENLTAIEIVDQIRSEKRLDMIRKAAIKLRKSKPDPENFKDQTCIEDADDNFDINPEKEYDPIDASIMEQVFG